MPDDPRDRRSTPSAGLPFTPPSVGRTPTREQYEQLNHKLDQIGRQLAGYSDRTDRAEKAGGGAWKAVHELGPQLSDISEKLGAIPYLVKSVDKLGTRFDEQDKRLDAIEKEQRATTDKLDDVHDRLEKIEPRVRQLEQDAVVAEAVDTAIEQTRRHVAKHRPWWRTTKGVVTVLGAVGTLIAGIIGVLSQR